MKWADLKFPPINLWNLPWQDIQGIDSSYIYTERTLLVRFKTDAKMKKFIKLYKLRKKNV